MSRKIVDVGNLDKLENVVWDYVEEKIDFLINQNFGYKSADILKCESPIEKLMYLSLIDLFKNAYYFDNRYDYFIVPQEEMEVGGSNYRADLVVRVAEFANSKNRLFAIECDGHEFHERTKEQARNDRFRERCFLQAGYTVIRFTGSEIVEDPDECAYQVWKIIKKKLTEG